MSVLCCRPPHLVKRNVEVREETREDITCCKSHHEVFRLNLGPSSPFGKVSGSKDDLESSVREGDFGRHGPGVEAVGDVEGPEDLVPCSIEVCDA